MRCVSFWLMVAALIVLIFLPAQADISHITAAVQDDKSINSSIHSNNSSGIQYKEQEAVVQSPQILVIGGKYYAEHPISCDSQMGQKTSIKNRAAGVSMNHEVSSAHNLSQTLEMATHDNSFQGEFGYLGSSGAQMRVDEDIQEGKVSIGVLKGGGAENGIPPSATALRNPSIDIEEDYIGNFHIEKNMTIEVPVRDLWFDYSWLPCCSPRYLDMAEDGHRFFNAEDIFDYTK